MSRAVVAGFLALVVVGGALPAVAATGQARFQTADGFESTTFRVTVYENGSATWTIEHRRPLPNETERQRFEDFARTFENNETELYRDFVDQAGALTRYGTNATGRQMEASAFRRSASVDPVGSVPSGVVRMSFRWSNFAVTSGSRVVVSDVFDGGFYVGGGQSLVFERGPGLAFASVRPEPDSQSDPGSLARSASVTYNGEQSFNDRRPFVEFGPREVVVTDSPTGAGAGSGDGDTGTGATPSDTDGSGTLAMAIAVVILVLGAGGAVAWRSGMVPTAGRGDGGTTTAGSDPPSGAPPAGETASTDQPDADPEPAVPDEELLSDSDRVCKLLEENGGRMKQVDIVDSTDWSKSKVSMLLSDMEEEGEISKLRVGRENIISLAGEEPDAAGSPFEDE